MIYSLSSAQHKQLTDRMGPLCIAIPAPLDDPDDWLQWAKSVIDEKHRQYVVAARIESVPVGPLRGSGLAAVIGQIDPPDRSFCWLVEVVLCDLDPPQKARHRRTAPQWPLSVLIENTGYRWPRQKEDKNADP